MTREERAEQLFLQGYNCAQAVTAAFADLMGMDVETAARLASSFGGGVGRLRELCGCVSGIALVSGSLLGYGDPDTGEKKAAHYARVQELVEKFRTEQGSLICRELLEGITEDTNPTPEARTEQYYAKRPCGRFVAFAAAVLEEALKAEGILEQ